MTAQITDVTPTTVPFEVPATSVVGTVSVTTPGGTTTSSGGLGFRTGIDTILDDVTVAASDGVLPNDLTVHFHSTEPFPNPQFECMLDGGPFARSCDAGVVFYDDLAPGMHSLQITARAEGWTDWPPLVVPFEIVNSDTSPPHTTLLGGPRGSINTRSATFTFSSEPGATFECSEDIPGLWVPCTSPYTRTGLADGQHFFAARAKDAARNVDPNPAGTSYTVDTTPPETWAWSIVPPAGHYDDHEQERHVRRPGVQSVDVPVQPRRRTVHRMRSCDVHRSRHRSSHVPGSCRRSGRERGPHAGDEDMDDHMNALAALVG